MANYFDQFDMAPANPPRVPSHPADIGGSSPASAGANYFDKFDEVGPSAWETAGRGIRQGASFNFADELEGVGSASGLPDWAGYVAPGARYIGGAARLALEKIAPDTFGHSAGDRYDETVARERAANEAAREAHPGAYLGGELGGSLATLPFAPELAPFKIAEGAGIVARTAKTAGNMAATGAAYGGVAGAGAGEGDVVDRLPSAATGAAIGGVAGPVVGATLRGAGAAAGYVGDHLTAFRNPRDLADQVVRRNLERDGADVPALANRMAEARQAGQDLTLADIAGPNTQGVAGNVARMPGEGRAPARQFLEDRQIGTDTAPGQGDRITTQLGAILGDDGAIGTADSIIASRAQKAAPAYEAAFRKPIDYNSPAGQNLDGMLEQIPNSARARANELLRLEDKGGEQMVFGHVPDRNGMYPIRTVPNTRQWDYIRRALWDDALGSKGFGKEGEVSQYGSAVRQLIGRVDEQLNTAVPALKAARSVYKGESDLLDALRAGKTAFQPSMSNEAVTKALSGLTPGEAQMYRLGAANALRDKLANAGDGVNKARIAFGSPVTRQKIGAMMQADPKGHADFVRYLNDEGAMFATRAKVLGGSPTAERLGETSDVDGMIVGAGKAVIEVGTGRIRAAMKTAFDTMSQVRPEMRGRVMNEARKVLFNPDPDAVRAFVARVGASGMPPAVQQRVLATFARALPRSVTEAVVGQ